MLNQRDAEWCFLFTSHALIQQHVCLAAGAKREAQNISLRGVIQTYFKTFGTLDSNREELPTPKPFDWKRPGHVGNVLESVEEGGRLPLESCAPMSELLDWRDKLPVGKEQLTPTEILKVNYERLAKNADQSAQASPGEKRVH